MIIEIVVLTALILGMLCRSFVHQLSFNYVRTKARIKQLFNKELDDQWWNPFKSFNNKRTIKWTIDIFGFRWITKVMVQFSDAYHTFNTIELGCYNMAITLLAVSNYNLAWYWGIVIFLFIGLGMLGGVFAVAYDKLWQKGK